MNIWIYSTNSIITNNFITRLLDENMPGHARARLDLGIRLDQTILPIFAGAGERLSLIRKYSKVSDIQVVIAGSGYDKSSRIIKNLYSGTLVFVHPKELEYHIQTMGSAALTYKEVGIVRQEWLDHLSPYFEHIIEMR